MPEYGRSLEGWLLTTARTPLPTAAPTFSFPSGLRGGSACAFATVPLTLPNASAIICAAAQNCSVPPMFAYLALVSQLATQFKAAGMGSKGSAS